MTQRPAFQNLLDTSALFNCMRKLRHVLLAGAFLVSGATAGASTATWSSGTTNGNWATTANWSGGSNSGAPASGDALAFGTTTGTTTLTDNLTTGSSSWTVAGIGFSGTSAYTINPSGSSNGFTLTTGITNSGTALQTINDNIALVGTESFSMTTGGGNIMLGGVVSDSGSGFSTAGAGTLTLTGSNTFTGGVTIAASTTLAVAGGGELGSGSYAGAIADAGTLLYASSASQTLSGNISGNAGGALTVNGGTLTLSGSNTYTGATTLTAGALVLVANSSNTASNVTAALSNSSALTLASGSTLELLSNNTGTTKFFPTNVTEAAGSGDVIYNIVAGDNNSGTTTGQTLVLADWGQFGPSATQDTFNFAVNNNYTLQIGSTAAGNGDLGFFNNTTVNSTVAGGTLAITGGMYGNHNGSTYYLTFGGAGNITSGEIYNGFTTGLDVVTSDSTGTVTLTSPNAYTGATTVYSGVFDFKSSSASTGSTTLNVDGGTMIADYTGGATANILAPTDVLSLNGSGGTFEVNGATASTTNSQTLGSLTLTGAGTINMINNNSGATTTGLVITSGTIAHSTGGSVNFVEPASGTSITLGSATTTSGAILAPYAFFTSGSNPETYAALSSGVVGAATLTSASTGINSFTSATANYSYVSPGSTDTATTTLAAFTADFNTGGTQTLTLGNNTLAINGILNTGGALTIQNGAGGTGSVTIPTTAGGNTELVLGGSSNITISSPITGTGGILSDDNTGTLTLSGSNAYGGATNLNAGTTSLSGSLPGGSAVTVGFGATLSETSAGTISGASTLTSNGTTTLGGVNSYTGATTVAQGTLSVTGTINSGTTGGIVVGSNAGENAILNISSGASVTANNLLEDTNTSSENAYGAVYQSGGSLTLKQGAGTTDLGMGDTTFAYGYYDLSGGTLTANEVDNGLGNSADGVFDMTGGTLTDSGYLIAGRGTGVSSGVYNITGGTVTATRIELNWGTGAGALGVLNIGGGSGTASVSTTASTTLGLHLANNVVVGTLGVANLLTNGTLTTGVVSPNGDTNPTTLFNFNGGTLQANIANASFMTGLTGAYVYSGGGTINNGGFGISIGQALLAPTGGGANGNPTVVNGGSGYVGAPLVTVSGAGGTGATAYATISSGTISGIVITNPGTGYTGALSFTLIGGGGSGAIISSVTPTADSSGGLIFEDTSATATTTLAGLSTYTGGTTITSGVVALGINNALSSAGAINVNGGTFNLATFNDTVGAVTLTTGTITGSTGTLTGASYGVQSGAVNGILGGAGAMTKTTGGTVTINSANVYTGGTTINAGTLVVGNAAALGSASSDALSFGASSTGTLSLNGNSTTVTDLTTSSTSPIIQDNNATTATLTVNNAGDNDTYAGVLQNGTNGTLFLTKSGSGTLTLTNASTYSGATTISAGTLALSGGGAGLYSSLGIGSVVANGTFDISQTGNQIIGDLSGSGVVALGSNNLELDDSNTGTFSGVIKDGGIGNGTGGSLTVEGGGDLVLSGSNSFTGTTTVMASSSSTIDYTSSAAFAQTSPIVVGNTSMVQLDGGITGGSESLTLAGSGPLANEGALFSNTGSNTVTGNVILSGAATIRNASTLSLTGGINNQGHTLTVTGPGATTIGTSAITGAGGLTMNGSGGVLTLTGSNGYTGSTSVMAGALFVNNSSGSGSGTGALSVAQGATLGGTGSSLGTGSTATVFNIGTSGTGTATVYVGQATASDSNTTGVLAVQASSTSSSTIQNANLIFNLAANASPNTLANSNLLNLGSTLLSSTTFTNSTVTFNPQGAIANNTTYQLVYNANGWTSDTALGINGQGVITSGLSISGVNFGSYAGSTLVVNGDYIDLDVQAVPEPSTWAMMLGGLALLILIQRRNSRNKLD